MTNQAIIYSEKFGSMATGEATLIVKKLSRTEDQAALIGYLPAGVSIEPVIFARGPIAACRLQYKAARDAMRRFTGPVR